MLLKYYAILRSYTEIGKQHKLCQHLYVASRLGYKVVMYTQKFSELSIFVMQQTGK